MNSKPQQLEPNLQDKLERARKEYQKWSGVVASPDLSPQAAEAARNLARSYRAAVMLAKKALAYQKKNDSVDLAKLFGLDTLAQGHQPYPGPRNPGWATRTPLPTSPSASNPANSRPKSPAGTFLMSPEQHEARAEQLRTSKSREANELATQHELLAKAIRKRSAS